MSAVAIEHESGIDRAPFGVTVDVLNQILADEHVLYVKLRNAHWNVTGPHYSVLQGLFAEQYGIVAKRIDEVAERTRELGAHTIGTMTEYLQRTLLQEQTSRSSEANDLLRNLLRDHESVARFIRDSMMTRSGTSLEVGTRGLLIDLMRSHEKMAWKLRAILSGGNGGPRRTRPVPYSVLYD